jgi:hypothetical protein
LLDPTNPEVRQAQMLHLEQSIAPRDFALVRQLAEPVAALSDESKLPLLDLTLPALQQMSRGQRDEFREQVEALIAADQKLSVFEYALRCIVARYLDPAFAEPGDAAPATSGVSSAMAIVLSRIAQEGEETPQAAQAAFEAGMRPLGGPSGTLLPEEQCPLSSFDSALRSLRRTPIETRRRCVNACAACIVADGKVTAREGELLRAVCAVLGCPMPPLLRGTDG